MFHIEIENHLKEFIPKIGKYLDGQGIDYCIYFGHQVDDKLFNRGQQKILLQSGHLKKDVITLCGTISI